MFTPQAGAGSVIDSQWEVGGWPLCRSKPPLPDRDRDGMPDDPSDAGADRDRDGYTNLEEYINQLAQTARTWGKL